MYLRPRYFRLLAYITWVFSILLIVGITIRSGVLLVSSDDAIKIVISFFSLIPTFLIGGGLGFLFFSYASSLEDFD